MRLVLLLLLVMGGCRGSDETSDDATLAFIRSSVKRCVGAKVVEPRSMPAVLGTLYSCVHNNFPCDFQVSPQLSYDADKSTLTVSRKVEKKICGLLSWTPNFNHVKLLIHKWHIKTKEQWFLLLQFDYFYIPHTPGCQGGRVEVTSGVPPNSSPVKYCGYRLPWKVNLQTNTVEVLVLWAVNDSSTEHVAFQARFETLVKKRDYDYQLHVKAPGLMELLPWKDVLSAGRTVQRFEVRAYLQNVLRVSVTTTKIASTVWFLYDGPAESSPMLDNTTMTTSGFVLLIKVHDGEADKGLGFYFTAETATQDRCDFNTEDGVRIKKDSARQLFCRQWFTTDNFPSVRIEKFHVLTPEVDTCKFFGFALGLDVNGNTTMLRPLCSPFVQELADPFFVAPNSRLFIFIYAYEALHVDIDVRVSNEATCPGLPVLCESPDLLIPKEIHVANRAILTTGTSNELKLLNTDCVALYRLPNMIICSRVTIKHVFGSSFYFYPSWQTQERFTVIRREFMYVGMKWAESSDSLISNGGKMLGVMVVTLGAKTKHIVDVNEFNLSGLRLSEVTVADELAYSTNIPTIWRFKTESNACFEDNKESFEPAHYPSYFPRVQPLFKDVCGELIMENMRRDYDFTFTVELPPGYHISFQMDQILIFCRLMCDHKGTMNVRERGLVFHFSSTSWRTEWHSLSNKAKFTVTVTTCTNQMRPFCHHTFYYRAEKNTLGPEAVNIEGLPRCEIGDSEYKLEEASTWRVARKACEREDGWEMLSISNRMESDALLTNAVEHPECSKKWMPMFQAEIVFIGLYQEKPYSQWRWISGEETKLSDWLSTTRYAHTYPTVYIDDGARPSAKITSSELLRKFTTGKKTFDELNELCAGMILFSQHVTPKWLAVKCDDVFEPGVVVCERRVKRPTLPPSLTTAAPAATDPTDTGSTRNAFCPAYWSWLSGRCWQLVDLQSSVCPAISKPVVVSDTDLVEISKMLELWYVDKMIKGKEAVWIGAQGNASECVMIQREEESLKTVNVSCALQGKRGTARYALCETDALNSTELVCPNRTVACSDNSCILSHELCDGESDCPQGEDESNCPMKPPCSAGRLECPKGDACIGVHQLCSSSTVCGEKFCPTRIQCTPLEFKCGEKCFDSKHRCDGEADCPNQSDEKSCSQTQHCRLLNMTRWLSKLPYRLQLQCPASLNTTVSCGDFGEEFSPCTDSQDAYHCFPRYRRCYYDLDVSGKVLFCPNRQHLVNCENFECRNAYKCPGSYCIPHIRRCDKEADCPGGEDELGCDTHEQCEGKIRCPDKGCILKSDWCNGVVDCPGGEDERMCEECPSGCHCDIYFTSCSEAPFQPQNQYFQNKFSLALKNMKLQQSHIVEIYANNFDLLKLDLTGNLLKTVLLDPDTSYKLKLVDLNLSYNSITQIKSYDFLVFPYLTRLSLKGNPLTSISDYGFWGLASMTEFDLSGLVIDNIYDDAFSGMYKLRNLNLSHNRIRVLTSDSFRGIQRLQVLDLGHNPLFVIHKETFKSAPNLQLLNTPAYKFCCAAAHVGKCLPEATEFSSCSDLMANSALKVCIWILAFTTFIGNIGVIVWRKQQETLSILNFLVQHLGFADMTMGLYLLIIAIADFYYRGHYYLFDEQWRESVFCKSAGFLSMMSSEMSVFVLLMIVLDRVCVVGLGRRGLGEKWTYAAVVIGWVISIALSVLPIVGLPYFGSGKYIQNGACFLFNITEGKVAGWEYATAIFIVFNLFALTVLVFGYTFTFISVSRKTGFGGYVEGQVARKLALVVLTDCCCWIPPITIGIMSLMEVPVNPQIAVWVAVFVFPLNSTINPFLYTFSAMNCCEESEEVDDDYMSHVHQIDADGHSITEEPGPSTSTAVACTIATRHTRKSKKSLNRRITPRPRSTRKPAKGQGNKNTGSLAVPKASYMLDQPRTPLDDIPEVCDASDEDETNVQISVSVAIKKGHRRSGSVVSKVSEEAGAMAMAAMGDEEDTKSFAASFNTTDPSAINIALGSL